VKKPRRRVYWTRERCINALRLFYRVHKEAVTDHDRWGKLTKQKTRSVFQRQYPSMVTMLRHWSDMYSAWEEAGVFIPARKNWSKDWTALEDEYLIEACGLISREEIARDLNRTPEGVHRRLYDLGINSRTHKGWTERRIAEALGVSRYLVRRYHRAGLLPYVRGVQCVFYDPADFLVIREIDWANVEGELADAIHRSLMIRAVNLIASQRRG
jgi:AraC-like DNA-binding protein